MYLAVWSVLIPLWPFNDYSLWRESYLGLLLVALVLEVLSFLVPMFLIHLDMKKQKIRYLEEADEASREIARLQRKLEEPSVADEREALRDRLQMKVERYHSIEHMPTWPVDFKSWRRFTIGNAALSSPLVGELLAKTDLWQRVLVLVERILPSTPG